MSTAFEDFVLSKVPRDQPFHPVACYIKDGDCIEFFISNESFYADRIDGLLTVSIGRSRPRKLSAP